MVRRRRSKVLLLVFSTVGVLLISEAGVRVAGYGADRGPYFQGYDGAGMVLMCYDGNPDGYLDIDLTNRAERQRLYDRYGIIDMEKTYAYTPYAVITPCDENKMRPGQVRPRKPDTLRLVALGDSFTYGHALKPGDPWPSQLESVLNAGTGGAGHGLKS
jgi:hypothetical protein